MHFLLDLPVVVCVFCGCSGPLYISPPAALALSAGGGHKGIITRAGEG